jgi:two-component system OmpR family response regulator/two-component system response regulator QseB
MIGESIVEGLRKEGYAVDWVRSGPDADLALIDQAYDLILLDLGLPGKQGLDVLASYRSREGSAPVLIVTARDATPDRVRGLDAGADDYLVKPFDLDELFARARALIRRSTGRSQAEITYAGLTLNPATHEVTFQSNKVLLSAHEFALLHALLSPPGDVVSKATLEEKLYGWGQEIESNTVEVYIHALRKKLGPELIINVRGVGYKVAAKA